jgi:hypothetical protein
LAHPGKDAHRERRPLTVPKRTDEMGSDWAESIDYLEAVVEMMKAAAIRLGISEDRVIAAGNRRNA